MASAGEVWSPPHGGDQYSWDSQMRLLAAVQEQHSLQQQAQHQAATLQQLESPDAAGGDPGDAEGGVVDDSGIQGVSVVDQSYGYAGGAVPSYVPTVIDTPEPKIGEGGCILCQVGVFCIRDWQSMLSATSSCSPTIACCSGPWSLWLGVVTVIPIALAYTPGGGLPEGHPRGEGVLPALPHLRGAPEAGQPDEGRQAAAVLPAVRPLPRARRL